MTTEEQFLSAVPSEVLLKLRTATEGGFGDYARSYSMVADAHNSRVVANIINCHMVDRLKKDGCDEDLVFCAANHRDLFVYQNKVIFIFKKLDEKLKSRNYPTQASRRFNAQEPLRGIPAALPRVEIGYVPDPAGAAINGIFAVYRSGNIIEWSHDLYDSHDPRQRDIKFA
ncbi:hypothetical protein OVA24_05890 [Luteolibacter sp. SL250]|uniref:hypothetical protein n=1 Tax=Luteolibacter sp. SL250 TaxID=2995170 RepID=UPI0022712F1F|nr:hypothetical protein [Luteolibacter sp. SL250]WAC20912.1 hypothetical protein OVA24_05890 [Luteolibacter sp. SL250]